MPAITIALVTGTMQRWIDNLRDAKEHGGPEDLEREVDHTIASIETSISTLMRLCPPDQKVDPE